MLYDEVEQTRSLMCSQEMQKSRKHAFRPEMAFYRASETPNQSVLEMDFNEVSKTVSRCNGNEVLETKNQRVLEMDFNEVSKTASRCNGNEVLENRNQ
jgi:hypothetical protein